MIQLASVEELKKEDIPKLLKMIDPVLLKRKELWSRLNRDADASKVFYNSDNTKIKIPFEQFITSVASGYLAGKAPVYDVQDNDTKEKSKIITEILDKEKKDDNYKEKMDVLLEYITNYNDDGAEHFNLTKDALSLTSCYEVIWEDNDNEIRYKNYSPLQTVAIYDYTIDRNLIGLVRKYQITDINENTKIMVELVDKFGRRTFSVDENYKEVKEEEVKLHKWKDVPATAYESDFSIFETVIDLINSFEQLIQNNRNLFEYNDTGCKLKIKGYAPQNPMFDEVEVDGKIARVANQARLQEDKFVLESKVFYIGEDGDIDWITKDVNDTATQNTIKTYLELMTMMSCVPNITDTGFTNADNNSAIKNKYFALSQRLIELRKGFEMMYQRRWELIFNRINISKTTNFDFRDIKIDLPVNIPTNEQEEVDNILKLKDIISDETIITKLGYNYESEKSKMDVQAEEDFEKNLENMKTFNAENPQEKGEVKDDKNIPNNDNNSINMADNKNKKGKE